MIRPALGPSRAPVSISGRWTVLVPLLPAQHMTLLRRVWEEEQSELGSLYDEHVGTFTSFIQLATGLDAVFAVETKTRSMALGIVGSSTLDLANGHARMVIAGLEGVVGTGILIEAAHLLVDYLLRTYPLRKLYWEIPEFRMNTVGTSLVGTVLREEGCYRKYSFYNGRHWDRYVFAYYRDRHKADLLAALRSRRQQSGDVPC